MIFSECGTEELRASRDPRRIPEVLAASLDSLFRMVRATGVEPALAEDAVQEACRLALEKAAQFRGDGPVFAWVARIAYREAARRRSERPRAELPAGLADRGPGPLESVEGLEERRRLEDALEEIPPRERVVLLLKTIEGLTGPEIARILEIPEGTVWSDLSRARERIRRRIEEPKT